MVPFHAFGRACLPGYPFAQGMPLQNKVFLQAQAERLAQEQHFSILYQERVVVQMDHASLSDCPPPVVQGTRLMQTSWI